jgi:hypothetical protein
LAVASINLVTERFRIRKLLGTGAFVILGLVVAGSIGISAIWAWLVAGTVVGLLLLLAYRFVVSHQLALVLPAVAAMMILGLAREATFVAYPGALAGSLLAILLVSGMAFCWYSSLRSS